MELKLYPYRNLGSSEAYTSSTCRSLAKDTAAATSLVLPAAAASAFPAHAHESQDTDRRPQLRVVLHRTWDPRRCGLMRRQGQLQRGAGAGLQRLCYSQVSRALHSDCCLQVAFVVPRRVGVLLVSEFRMRAQGGKCLRGLWPYAGAVRTREKFGSSLCWHKFL